jgi:hypothetical protein
LTNIVSGYWYRVGESEPSSLGVALVLWWSVLYVLITKQGQVAFRIHQNVRKSTICRSILSHTSTSTFRSPHITIHLINFHAPLLGSVRFLYTTLT